VDLLGRRVLRQVATGAGPERAELLGGRLEAGPTQDGYRVELWLPELVRA
jgi:hypothetical protein